MSEQHHRPAVPAETGPNVIPANVLSKDFDRAPEISQVPGERAAAAIDRGLVSAGRLERDERLGQLQRVFDVAFTEGEQWVHVEGVL